jgi:TPR repeat protein
MFRGVACQAAYFLQYHLFKEINPDAMYKLGDMYYYGNHVEKDLDASFYWYCLAKKQNPDSDKDYEGFLVASIAMRIGRALLFGEGTKKNLIHALYELRTAEALFYDQILLGDEFSVGQLPKVQKFIQIAITELDGMVQ